MQKTLYIFILTALCTMMLGGEAYCKNAAKRQPLRIGIAEVNYTPPVGKDLVGNYRGDDYASRGIHDSLYSRAVVFEGSNGEKFAMLTVDICWMRKPTIDMMRGYIAERTDIPFGNILISSTHTHSGPKSLLEAPGAEDYLKVAASAAVVASGRMKNSELCYGTATESRVSFNRRLKCRDGRIHMCWEKLDPDFVIEPAGSIDSVLTAVEIVQDGLPQGMIVNFGCHATTLTGNNWLYSADYPGYVVQSIKRMRPQGFIPMYFNAPCGNVTQVDYRRGFIDTYQECERIGYMLGVTAQQAVVNSTVGRSNSVVVTRVLLPLKRIAITEQQRQWAQQIMDRVAREGMPPLQADGMPDEQYAKDWLDLYAVQNQIDTLEIMVARVGDVAVVGLPGELFSELGAYIKEHSPFAVTVVCGIANDNKKYFPTDISFTQGPEGCFTPMATGYETTPGTTLYQRGSGEKIARCAVEQLARLAGEK